MGLGPSAVESTQEGDKSCGIQDYCTLFVIRRVKDQVRYDLVGEAQVHGFMDGEAMSMEYGVYQGGGPYTTMCELALF